MVNRRTAIARMLQVAAAAMVAPAFVGEARAQAPEPTPWEPASMPPGSFSFIQDAGRARFANEGTASERILRSNQDGSLWSEVDLPPPLGGYVRSLAIDPKAGDVRFVTGAGGLFRRYRHDETSGWTLVLPTSDERIGSVFLAPGDPGAVFVRLRRFRMETYRTPPFNAPMSREIEVGARLVRSLDDGQTWEDVSTSSGTSCPGTVVPTFAHPDEPDLLFGREICADGASRLLRSTDRGTTWETFSEPGYGRIVAGAPGTPRRLFLESRGSWQENPGRLRTSDDGGRTWADVPLPAADPSEPPPPPIRVAGARIGTTWAFTSLVVDPSEAQRIYASQVRYVHDIVEGSPFITALKARISTSTDLGVTWTDLSTDGMQGSDVTSLALSPDGRSLVAVTGRGGRRLPLA